MVFRCIDTNVFLRHFLADDVRKAIAARELLLRVEAGTERVTTPPLALFELVFTLHRGHKVQKHNVAALLSGILAYRGLHFASKELWRDAFAVWLEYPIDFTDAYNVAFMRSAGIKDVYAWDRGYDHVSGIKRIEPSESVGEEAA